MGINLYPVYKAIDHPNRPNTYPVDSDSAIQCLNNRVLGSDLGYGRGDFKNETGLALSPISPLKSLLLGMVCVLDVYFF